MNALTQKILMTGATGFVGKSVFTALQNQGKQIRLALRTGEFYTKNSDLKNVDISIIPHIDGDSDWSHALSSVDVIIHLAARVHMMDDNTSNPLLEYRKVNVDGTLNLARQAAAAGAKRFIYISSVKVNGEYSKSDKSFTENDISNPQDAYSISKYEAEQGLMFIAQQTGMEVVIIRPPLVYGAGVKANFATMMRMVKRSIPLPLGSIHNKRSFICVENLVSFILKCADHPAAANEVFLVSDGHDLSTTELLRACAMVLGVKSRLIPIPQKMIEIFATLLGKKALAQRLCDNLQVDITKARTLLDWAPPITVEQGLRAAARDFKE